MLDNWVSEYQAKNDARRMTSIYLAIYTVTINGERNVNFSYDDPNMQIFAEDDPR